MNSSKIDVKWGKQTIPLVINDFECTIGDLKRMCQKFTEIDPSDMKLLIHGAVMKDDNRTLNSCDFRSNSKVILIGSKSKSKSPADKARIIKHEMESIKIENIKVFNDIEAYGKAVNECISDNCCPKRSGKLRQQGAGLAEQLMRILFALDNINGISEFDNLRIDRKKFVDEVQKLLQHVDDLKAKLDQ